MSAFLLNQQLPILPGRFQPSTFGVCGLNYCVRYGNRWDPTAIVTGLEVHIAMFLQNCTEENWYFISSAPNLC